MPASPFTPLVGGFSFLEAPRWHDGRLWLSDFYTHRVIAVDAAVHADLSAVAGGHCNNMVVDAQRRAWVGNFGFDLMGGTPPQHAALARVDPDGRVHVAAEGQCFPNGSAITPDGRTLLVGESFDNRVSAFDIGRTISSRCTAAVTTPSTLIA